MSRRGVKRARCKPPEFISSTALARRIQEGGVWYNLPKGWTPAVTSHSWSAPETSMETQIWLLNNSRIGDSCASEGNMYMRVHGAKWLVIRL